MLMLAAAAGWASGCVRGPDSEAELHSQLMMARQRAVADQQRLLAVEARLADVERRRADPRLNRTASENQQLLQRLDELVRLNQALLGQIENNAIPAARPASSPPPECSPELSTEEKIRHLVSQLRSNRSPWLVDGMSYEESQALRLLLRRERPLDSRNPWHTERALDRHNPWQ